MNPADGGWLVRVPETVFSFAEVTPPEVLRRAVETAVEEALDFVAADEAEHDGNIEDPADARGVIRRVASWQWSRFTRDRLAEAVTGLKTVMDVNEAFDEGDLDEEVFRCFRELDGLVSGIRNALDRLERGEKAALAEVMERRTA